MKNTFIFGLMALLLVSLSTSCARIDAGHVGIRVKQFTQDKGVQDVTECTGFVWYNPFTTDIVEWPTYVQHVEYTGEHSFIVNSSDGSEFHASPILNYNTKREAVVEVYKKYRRELEELQTGFIKTAVFEAFRLSANSFTADSLVSHRENFEKEVKAHLEKTLTQEGFSIQQFTSGLEYPPTFKQAIDAKNAAVQTALMTENKVKTAEAQARIKQADAEGNAQSMLIQARAEAEANKLKQMTLTPMLLQQQFVEKWNGVLPVYGQTPTLFKTLQ